ncbi:hypothetical protein [Desulfolucanica intricata]|uniref:hypothetical protein n=1 Tax=Desulfolucanica intricata TaxID=1285191 RepID=UPI00082F1FAE|nr:hypothetical protein [Desulfolucanica intricata]
MNTNIGDQITNEHEGTIEFFCQDPVVFDETVKEASIFYKLLGEARFRLVRNNKFELVFIHLTEDWMRHAKFNLKEINYSSGLNIKLSWNKNENLLEVKSPNDKEYRSIKAIQIEN